MIRKKHIGNIKRDIALIKWKIDHEQIRYNEQLENGKEIYNLNHLLLDGKDLLFTLADGKSQFRYRWEDGSYRFVSLNDGMEPDNEKNISGANEVARFFTRITLNYINNIRNYIQKLEYRDIVPVDSGVFSCLSPDLWWDLRVHITAKRYSDFAVYNRLLQNMEAAT